MVFMLVELGQNQPSRFRTSLKTFRKTLGGVSVENFAKKIENFIFYDNVTTCSRANTSVGLNHPLVKCQGSSRTYGASEDFSLLRFVGVLAEHFAKKAKNSLFSDNVTNCKALNYSG